MTEQNGVASIHLILVQLLSTVNYFQSVLSLQPISISEMPEGIVEED
jgi:hypothetical protein